MGGRCKPTGIHALNVELKIILKLSVGSGIEDMVSNPVRPIRIAHFGNPTDRFAESPTGSPPLSKLSLDFEEIRVTYHPDTELKL